MSDQEWNTEHALYLEKQVRTLLMRVKYMQEEIRRIYWEAEYYCEEHPNVRLTYTGSPSRELGFFCSSCKPNYYEGL